MKFFKKIIQVWNAKDLRNKILFVLGLLVVYRFVAHIPLPGIDRVALGEFFSNNNLLGLMDMFSGGGFSNFSIIALGIAPYITASIIMQLLTMVVPKLEELSKDGEAGYNKINQYTRWLTVPLCLLQASGIIALLNNSQVFINLTSMTYATSVITMLGGTMFLVWIGDLITEKKIGNGVSILIFAGILAKLPGKVFNFFDFYEPSQLWDLILFVAVAFITLIVVIYITSGQRNIPISYGKILRGTRMAGGIKSQLPIKVNQAGVIPIIFAISLVMFPQAVANFLENSSNETVVKIAGYVSQVFSNDFFHGVMYFLLVIGFTFFYTSIVFQPQKVAENLQKQGGFIPGIRPGKPTENFLLYVSNRVMLAGALFLGAIAVLPKVLEAVTNSNKLLVGGTSLLIVVSVVLDIVQQIDSQLTMRDYESL